MKSHPLRMRGLKHFCDKYTKQYLKSHPLRMRGLKLISNFEKNLFSEVASFADAWIETSLKDIKIQQLIVASFADAWIETSML